MDENSGESFEDIFRSIAREFGRSVERAVDNVELDDVADAIGVDPSAARDWVESTGSWLRSRAEQLGDDLAFRVSGPGRAVTGEDPLQAAAPHPLDLPTEEQGRALAALDSGRWVVEPGTETLAARGDGPGPSDALGIVRELRVRDWIGADGEMTLVGSHALGRWLAASTPR